MLDTTRNFLVTGWACALPSGGGFDMMGSAMVAMAITDSFTRASHPKSENMWFKCSKPYLKSRQSSLISNPPEVCQVLCQACQILHDKKGLFKLLSQQVCTPQASSCHVENMKTSWSCQWKLLASTKAALFFESRSDWSNFKMSLLITYPRCQCPSHVLFHSLWSPPVSKSSEHRGICFPSENGPSKPPNVLMLQTSMTSSQVTCCKPINCCTWFQILDHQFFFWKTLHFHLHLV